MERIERGEIRFFDDDNPQLLAARIESDETIFNPNKHRLSLLDETVPRAGEVWIEPLCHPERSSEAQQRSGVEGPDAIGWRLFDAEGVPVGRAVLDAAIERLLCNAAIERAVTRDEIGNWDNRFASE